MASVISDVGNFNIAIFVIIVIDKAIASRHECTINLYMLIQWHDNSDIFAQWFSMVSAPVLDIPNSPDYQDIDTAIALSPLQ